MPPRRSIWYACGSGVEEEKHEEGLVEQCVDKKQGLEYQAGWIEA
jgi:hypothetical protein